MTYAYSLNEEHYHGSYDTPEDAAWQGMHDILADEADESPCVWVGEICQPKMRCPFDADDAIERVQEVESDDAGELVENFNPTPAERADLSRRLQEAWDEWMAENRIDPGFFTIQKPRLWRLEFHKPYDPEGEAELSECGVLKMTAIS